MRRRVAHLLGTALVALCVVPATARAGTYTVSACDAAGGTNATWTASSTHGGVAIYQRCPTGGREDAGLVTRASANPAGWTVPTGAASRWTFRAPPGAAVVGIRAHARFHQSSQSPTRPNWRAVLHNGSRVVAGCNTAAGGCGGAIYPTQYIPIPASAAVHAETACIVGPCPVSWQPNIQGNVWARFMLYAATVTVSDATRPSIRSPRGPLWTNGWVSGRRSVTFDAVDNVGIREMRVLLDGRVVRGASRDCNAAALRCPDWPGATLDVPTLETRDGSRTLTLAAVDRAGNVGSISRKLAIDNTAPAAPLSATVRGGSAWRSTNRFAFGWRNPAQTGTSPITSVYFELCPAGRDKGCVSGRRPGTNARLDGVTVPHAGAWSLRLWLGDAAGNARRETAAPVIPLRYDPEPPTVAILPPDPRDPARVRVAAADRTSGLARGEIEVRRRGNTTWRSLDTVRSGNGFAAMLNDGQMRDGRYELRARVFDAASNERSTDRLTTGKRATIRLPVRAKTSMRVGHPRKVRARRSQGGKRRLRTIYVRRPTTNLGRRVRVGGRLTTPGGNPLQGVSVAVTARLDEPGARFQPVATLTTSRTGRFQYRLPAGPNRIVRFHYSGAPTIRPQTRYVNVRVRSASTIKASRRNVVNGEVVTFRGRLRGGWVPAKGKLVEVQFFARGKWRTFATTRSNSRGRWRFDGTRGTVRWQFRARIPRETGYPFTLGKSRRVRVTVRGV